MKIHFKSTLQEQNQEKKIIEFTSRLNTDEYDEGFRALVFEENRNGKIITNRIEYNEDTLRIYSGITSIYCKLNEINKNNYVVEGIPNGVFIYTKMININILDSNNLLFEYYVCADDKFEHNTHIILELKIYE